MSSPSLDSRVPPQHPHDQGGIAERKTMIDRQHSLSVRKQAATLGISRGSVYYLPRPVRAADLALMLRIDKLHLARAAG
jgi:putative transposase